MELSEKLESKLLDLGRRLIDQQSSRIIVQPLGNSFGYWFGGGNLCVSKNGEILISGRFRNEGDARTGTGAGARGLECSVFSGNSPDTSFEKVLSFSKEDLSHTEEVVSIEGVSLINNSKADDSYEFIISTEKKTAYPKTLINFQKPGTGVWSIDLLKSDNGIDSFDLGSMHTIARSEKGSTLHYNCLLYTSDAADE